MIVLYTALQPVAAATAVAPILRLSDVIIVDITGV